jgi:glycerol-3-phosphate acyltransferase PlsX
MGLAGMVFGVIDEPGAPWAATADALKLRLLEAAAPIIPDNTGGGMLLGVDGVCVISHGSSSATAIVNAVRVARDCVQADVVTQLNAAMANLEAGARDAG